MGGFSLCDMQHARRNSVGASHRDHPRFDYTHVHKRYDRSFATTATSIGPKWRRDSAKRDAKQVLFSPAIARIGSSTYRNGAAVIYASGIIKR